MSAFARIAVYCLLMAVGIPWYWPRDDSLVVLGLPAWVMVAILAGFVAAVFTAWCVRRAEPP